MAEFYCGPAPEPQNLLTAWNADPVAIAFCAVLILLHRRHGRPAASWPVRAAVLLLLVLYLSPLCALTVALFSARVLHHVLLVAIAAPLLAMAFPQRKRGGPPSPDRRRLGEGGAIVQHQDRDRATGIDGAECGRHMLAAAQIDLNRLDLKAFLRDEHAGAARAGRCLAIVEFHSCPPPGRCGPCRPAFASFPGQRRKPLSVTQMTHPGVDPRGS